MPLFLLLVAVPIIEIALFIEVGGLIGLWPTIAIVLLTAALGMTLLRAQGMAALAELQSEIRAGGNPAPALANGALILVAGLLLLTPGFFTDSIGFLLLVPPLRAAVIRQIGRRIVVRQMHRTAGAGGGAAPGPGTVDGEYEVVEPKTQAGERPSGWTRAPKLPGRGPGHTGD